MGCGCAARRLLVAALPLWGCSTLELIGPGPSPDAAAPAPDLAVGDLAPGGVPPDLLPPDLAPPPDLTPSPWGLAARPANPTCVAPARPSGAVAASLQRAFAKLSFTVPVALVQPPGDAKRWLVVEKRGVVRAFANDPQAAMTSTVVDISARVESGPNEAGLLGIALHPGWQQNGYAYLSYTAPCPNGRPTCASSGLLSTVSRFTSKDGGATLDPASEKILLQLDQPEQNHNGGNLAFGPDGRLYLGFGDGGGAGDRHGQAGNGQDTQTLLGKLLRIDVDAGDPYAIPDDNPFAKGGGKPEIYAYGLRNPWRFSFDSQSGALWVGDVGQDSYEEVDRVRLGGNYGWRVMEGFHCYDPQNCNMNGYDLPVVEYSHAQGCSITGGYVYRGAAVPSLAGTYLYGDYCSGTVWALQFDAQGKAAPAALTGNTPMTSFGQGLDGEVYLVGSDGRIYQVVPGMQPADTFPKKLSLTGCFDRNDPRQPLPALIPYEVASPLWSDGADKRRWMALPDGTTIQVGDDGDFAFPVGTVLAKEFTLGGKRVETRLLVRHDDGEWGGYSYRWDDAETDADLLPANATRVVGNQTWYYPSRAECLQCHTVAAGRSLGPEVLQLNHEYAYPGGLANQLATLDHIGLFDQPLAAGLPAIPSPSGAAPLADRARSYLHANCSFCHRPNSTGRGNADFRYQTDWKAVGACNAAPSEGNLGIQGAALVKPGDPASSIVSRRMHALDSDRMPPLGTGVVDPLGTKLIDDWITSLQGCP